MSSPGAARIVQGPYQVAGADAVEPLSVVVEPAQQAEQILPVKEPQLQVHLARVQLIGAPRQWKFRGKWLLGIDGVGEFRQLEILVSLAQVLDPVQTTLLTDDALSLEFLELRLIGGDHRLLLVDGSELLSRGT